MTGAQAVIDGWRQWEAGLNARPRIVGPLGGGRSNRNLLLDAGSRALVLRLNAGEALLPGGGRRAEVSAWRAASEAGIAPPLVFADTQKGFMVSEYIDSDLPARPHKNAALGLQALDLMQRCHRLQVELPAIDYHAHVETYWRMIRSAAVPAGSLAGRRGEMQAVLDTLLTSDLQWGVCHHDPVVANFVGRPERLYLLDWEYAARGLQLMDYAALVAEWGVDLEAVAAAAGTNPRLLVMAQDFYRYLCGLWEVLANRDHAPS